MSTKEYQCHIGYLPGSPGFMQNKFFVRDSKDKRLEPFAHLRNELEARGILVETADCGSAPYDILLVHRIDINAGRLLALLSECADTRLIYIVTEEEATCPLHCAKVLRQLAFDAVLTWRPSIIADGAVPYRYPNPTRAYESGPGFNERNLLVAIAANKAPRLFANNQLYTTRRILFEKLMNDSRFHLYGPGWSFNPKAPGTYGGTIENKLDAVAQFRFSLILENTREPGGVTEKIFDAMSCGSVPVYLGAPDIAEWIPRTCYIDLEELGAENLCEKLAAISHARWSAYQESIRAFFSTSAYRQFTEPGFVAAVDKALQRAKLSNVKRSRTSMWLRLISAAITCPSVFFYRGGQRFILDLLAAPFKLPRGARS